MNISALILAAGVATASPAAPSPEAVSLARQLLQAQHREALSRDIYAKQLRAAMPICKSDAKCQADLDRAIAGATEEVARKQVENMAQLLARKLTLVQMRVALKFYTSPEGQTLAAAQESMTDELAQIGHASSIYVQKRIAQTFCPSHSEICVNDVGQKGAQPPKS